MQPLLSVRQVAALLGVCAATVYRMCEQGELPHFRVECDKDRSKGLEEVPGHGRIFNGFSPDEVVASDSRVDVHRLCGNPRRLYLPEAPSWRSLATTAMAAPSIAPLGTSSTNEEARTGKAWERRIARAQWSAFM